MVTFREQRKAACEDCGAMVPESQLEEVQWAVGSTGFVCQDCLKSGRYEEKPATSEDGLATVYWARESE